MALNIKQESAACPYISFVATSRNDNHGGSLTRRMQIFVNSLAAQCKRHNLPAELILVEWNPPADRKPLAAELNWPQDPMPLQIRIVTVPNSLHRSFKCSEHLPLFQMIAKNAGIRRSTAPYILATNIDILFNDELMAYLAERKLEKDKMYRIDRYDAMSDVPLDAPVQEQLAYCSKHILRVGRREGTIRTTMSGEPQTFESDIVPRSSGLRFGRGWTEPMCGSHGRPYRFMSDGAEIIVESDERTLPAIVLDLEPASGVRNKAFWLSIERETGEQVAFGKVFGRHRIHFKLPISPDSKEVLTLRIPEGGQADPRIAKQIDAKVHLCDWSSMASTTTTSEFKFPDEARFKNFFPELIVPPRGTISRLLYKYFVKLDIVDYHDGIILSDNWSAFEMKDGEFLRHADNNAVIVAENRGHDARELTLEIETASGLSYESFELQILDSNGAVVSSHSIRGNPKRRERYLKNRDNPQYHKSKKHRSIESSFSFKQHLFRNRFREKIHSLLPLKKNSLNQFTLRIANCPSLPADGHVFRAYKVYSCVWKKDAKGGSKNTQPLLQNAREQISIQEYKCINAPQVDERSGTFKPTGPANVHMNTCGDFTLMAKEHWFQIKGYPELEMYSMHIDSLGCHAAVNAGLKEVVLEEPMRIYHIEHGAGSGWTPEGEEKLFGRMREKGIPVIEFSQLVRWATEMREKGPIAFNGEDWGLARHELKETRIG